MLKKILISVGIIIILLVAALFYLNHRNRTLSPPGAVSLSNDGITVAVIYSRPSVRDRLIFGPEDQGALQPYGMYWRLGANEATEITFSDHVLFHGAPVEKGTYRIYAVPFEQEFEIRLNSELGKWGAFDPAPELDVLAVKVPVIRSAEVEQFTVSMEPVDQGVNVIFEWSDVRFEIPVTTP